MKSLLTTFGLILLFLTSYAQPESYFVIGYGMEFNKTNKAYSHWNSAFSGSQNKPTSTTNNDGLTQTDYTGIEFDKDGFNSTNWVVKMGMISDEFYFESDMSYLMQTLGVVLYEYIADKDLKYKLHYGVGDLRKIDKNTGIDSAFGYGGAANLWNLDLAFGGNFKVGVYTGFSAFSIGGFKNVSPLSASNSATYQIFPNGMTYGSLGLGFHVSIENQALISLRVNRIRTRSNKEPFHEEEYEPWRGLEIYPSIKLWAGDEAGIYLEVFGKYAMFREYENPEIILPNYNLSTIGVSLGFYVPYY